MENVPLLDATQKGVDLISKELSSAIREYRSIPPDVPQSLVGFLERKGS